MADLTGTVSFDGYAFADGCEAWDEELGVDLAKETLLNVEGALLGRVRLAPRVIRVKGLLLGTAAAGPRADARALIEALTAAFLGIDGGYLKLWSDRQIFAKCTGCLISYADPAGFQLQFDGTFETASPYWESTTGLGDGFTMDPSTKYAVSSTNTGTVKSPLYIEFRGRIATSTIKVVNRFNNLVNNSTFSRAGTGGAPANFTAENPTATGIDYMAPSRIWRDTTSASGDASALYQDIPFPCPGAVVSAAVTMVTERYSGSNSQAYFQVLFLKADGSTLATHTSDVVTGPDAGAFRKTLENLTAPALTATIRLRLVATVTTGGSLMARFYAPIINRAATVASWWTYQRDHLGLTVTGPLAPNEIVKVDAETRTVSYFPLNAWNEDGTKKLTDGWEWLEVEPGINELYFEHATDAGTGYCWANYSYTPRFYTP